MEKVQEGDLIVVEGIDGSGKTSHSKKLAAFLGAEWRRFPNRDTPSGKILGEHLLKKWQAAFRHDTATGDTLAFDHDLDALVFQAIQIANRVEFAQDFRTVLKKQHIVCDRYWPSGYAYGGADGLDKQYMVHVHEGLMQPQLVILFDVEVEEAFRRMGARDNGVERYEGNRGFLNTVANNYRELWDLKKDDPTFVKINANGSVEETWAQLMKVVEERVRPFKIS